MQTEDEYELAYFRGYSDAQTALALSNTLWVRFATSVVLFMVGVLVGMVSQLN